MPDALDNNFDHREDNPALSRKYYQDPVTNAKITS